MIKNPGFTLIELMIAIAIVAILVALALPNYQDSIRKGRRSDAQTVMLDFAGTAERVFTGSNAYNFDSDSNGTTDLAEFVADANDATDFYNYVQVSTATTYSVTAAPAIGQVNDRCGTMTLSQTGRRTSSGTLSGCW